MSVSPSALSPTAFSGPLPADVVVHASWFGRARQFPIFSGAWFRYRSAAFLSGLFVAALLGGAFAALPRTPGSINWPIVLRTAAVFGMSSVTLVLAGPALAVCVRRR